MRDSLHIKSLLTAILMTILGGIVCHAEITVLIKEICSREHSLHVSGVYELPSKDAVSRELSLQVNDFPDDPYKDIVSRETDVVVTTEAVPDIITGLNVNVTPTGESATLDWAHYNEIAQHDVVSYRIYISDQPFTDISSMTPYVTVSAGTTSYTITGLTAWQDHYFAVVPVDVLGGYDPSVNYAAAYVLSPEVLSREFSISVDIGMPVEFKDVTTRELDLVVASADVPARIADFSVFVSPQGDIATLDWSSYNTLLERDIIRFDIYYSSSPFTNVTAMTPYLQVPAADSSIVLAGLTPWTDHYFAIVPVDVLGGFDPVVNYGAAYPVAPEVISREFTLFIGQPDPVSKDSVSRELVMLAPDDSTPAPVTGLESGFAVTTSVKAYQALDLDWSYYDELAQLDIVRYRVYVGSSYFDDVSSMEPFTYAPAGSGIFTLTGLDAYGIYYVAVVAEDVLGNFDPVVRSVSSQASSDGVGDVINLSVTCGSDSLLFHWDPPTNAAAFLDYYNVYFGGALIPDIVESTATTYEVTGLDPAHGYPMRITTVDIFDFESGGSSLLAATWLLNPANFVVGAWTNELTLTWDASLPSELLSYYAVFTDSTAITNVTGLTPISTTTTTNMVIAAFEEFTNYYYAVVAVNIAGSYNPVVNGILPEFDLDGDGLSNDDEKGTYGTDPYDADSDHDGLTDYDELFVYLIDPLNPDIDDDQLLDGDEFVWGTFVDVRDSDTDLLGDGWEVMYGLNPLVINNITLDVDGDGFNYYEEYIADTNPTNALSFFRISGVIPGLPVKVYYESSAHRVYSLLWQTNLFSSGWILHDASQEIPGTGAETYLPDSSLQTQRFYKVNVNLP